MVLSSGTITNPQQLLGLDREQQEAFFDGIDPDWYSRLEFIGDDDAGLDYYVEEYATHAADYSVATNSLAQSGREAQRTEIPISTVE